MSLIDHIPGISDVYEQVKKVWNVVSWVGTFLLAPLAPVLLLVKALWDHLPQVYNFLDTMHSQLQSARGFLSTPGIGEYYSKLNTVVPLFEFFVMWGILLSISAAGAVVRIIKSFIPTVS